MKGGDFPQHTSRVSKVWKGVYKDEAVAIKALRVPPDEPKSVGLTRDPSERCVSL